MGPRRHHSLLNFFARHVEVKAVGSHVDITPALSRHNFDSPSEKSMVAYIKDIFLPFFLFCG